MYSGKSDEDVVKSGNMDDVFCNPIRIKMANEARKDAVNELISRGYTKHEAEKMINNY